MTLHYNIMCRAQHQNLWCDCI